MHSILQPLPQPVGFSKPSPVKASVMAAFVFDRIYDEMSTVKEITNCEELNFNYRICFFCFTCAALKCEKMFTAKQLSVIYLSMLFLTCEGVKVSAIHKSLIGFKKTILM